MGNIAIDSYDKLYIRNENTGSPTTFQDSSTANPKTITANGNAKQLPIKFNKSAGFFNGTSDYVQVADSSDLDFGTGDFDIEVFANFTVVQTCHIFDFAAQNLALFYTAGTIRVQQAGGTRINTAWTPTANTWYHFRVQRSSGTTTLYIDNASTGSPYAGSDTCNCGATGLFIGKTSDSAQYFSGWMKELRISNATRTVAVPTTAYTSDSNTKLLLHFDTPASSPIAPAIYFDGTGDNIKFPNGGDFDVGSGDFCIEGFFRNERNSDSTFVAWDSGVDANKGIWVSISHGASNSANVYINGTLKLSATPFEQYGYNKWHHLCVERYSGTLKIFIDGKQAGTVADSTAVTANSAVSPRIGTRIDDTSGAFLGSMREFRFSNVARYSGAPFTPSQTGFVVDSNTKLYVKGNEANGVTTFVDSETTPKTITTTGNAKITYTEDYRSCIFKDDGNTGHKPYPVGLAKVDFFAMGNGVGYFDGTNSYLTVPTSSDWEWAAPSGSTNDFTLEAYVRHNDDGYGTVFSRATVNYNALSIYWVDGSWQWNLNNSTSILTGTGATAFRSAVNQWQHVVVCRSGSTLRVFCNGTLLASGTDNSDYTKSEQLQIGFNYTFYFKGLMDNIRIAKGVARYTATFDPPYDPAAALGFNQIIWMD